MICIFQSNHFLLLQDRKKVGMGFSHHQIFDRFDGQYEEVMRASIGNANDSYDATMVTLSIR